MNNITDEDIEKAWGNSKFGNVSKNDIIIDTLKRVAQGWGIGHTAMCIVKELGLIENRNGQNGLSDKGLEYLLSRNKVSHVEIEKLKSEVEVYKSLYADIFSRYSKVVNDEKIEPKEKVEDRFTHWIKEELKYRKGYLVQCSLKEETNWYKAQVGILETVINQLSYIGEPYHEVTQEDIWNQAEAAYKKHTP